jgi:hypothetical protein
MPDVGGTCAYNIKLIDALAEVHIAQKIRGESPISLAVYLCVDVETDFIRQAFV